MFIIQICRLKTKRSPVRLHGANIRGETINVWNKLRLTQLQCVQQLRVHPVYWDWRRIKTAAEAQTRRRLCVRCRKRSEQVQQRLVQQGAPSPFELQLFGGSGLMFLGAPGAHDVHVHSVITDAVWGPDLDRMDLRWWTSETSRASKREEGTEWGHGATGPRGRSDLDHYVKISSENRSKSRNTRMFVLSHFFSGL